VWGLVISSPHLILGSSSSRLNCGNLCLPQVSTILNFDMLTTLHTLLPPPINFDFITFPAKNSLISVDLFMHSPFFFVFVFPLSLMFSIPQYVEMVGIYTVCYAFLCFLLHIGSMCSSPNILDVPKAYPMTVVLAECLEISRYPKHCRAKNLQFLMGICM